jgi:hypothetical protein
LAKLFAKWMNQNSLGSMIKFQDNIYLLYLRNYLKI